MARVVAGFFSFTEITEPSEHRSYNEWHQLDHLPEQLPLEGVVYGQRWVCTPACRDARMAASSRLEPVHYLTLCLLADPLEDTLRTFVASGEDLRAAGRFHQHRKARLSGPLRLVDTRVAQRVSISAEAVPYRPNRGVYVTVELVESMRVDHALGVGLVRRTGRVGRQLAAKRRMRSSPPPGWPRPSVLLVPTHKDPSGAATTTLSRP